MGYYYKVTYINIEHDLYPQGKSDTEQITEYKDQMLRFIQ